MSSASGAVLLDEARLADPVLAGVEAEAAARSELPRPEQIAAAVAGAVEHGAAVEPVRVEVLEVDPVLCPDVLEGDVAERLRIGPGRRLERDGRCEPLCDLDVEMPRPEADDLLSKLGVVHRAQVSARTGSAPQNTLNPPAFLLYSAPGSPASAEEHRMEPVSVETQAQGPQGFAREPRGLRERPGPRDPDHRARVRRLRHRGHEVPRRRDCPRTSSSASA